MTDTVTAQSFATSFWDRTLAEAQELFNYPSPVPSSKSYMKDMREKLAAETAMLVKLRQMAQAMGGNLHSGMKSDDEVERAEAWMKAAESQLGVKIPRNRKEAKAQNKSKSNGAIQAARYADSGTA